MKTIGQTCGPSWKSLPAYLRFTNTLAPKRLGGQNLAEVVLRYQTVQVRVA